VVLYVAEYSGIFFIAATLSTFSDITQRQKSMSLSIVVLKCMSLSVAAMKSMSLYLATYQEYVAKCSGNEEYVAILSNIPLSVCR